MMKVQYIFYLFIAIIYSPCIGFFPKYPSMLRFSKTLSKERKSSWDDELVPPHYDIETGKFILIDPIHDISEYLKNRSHENNPTIKNVIRLYKDLRNIKKEETKNDDETIFLLEEDLIESWKSLGVMEDGLVINGAKNHFDLKSTLLLALDEDEESLLGLSDEPKPDLIDSMFEALKVTVDKGYGKPIPRSVENDKFRVYSSNISSQKDLDKFIEQMQNPKLLTFESKETRYIPEITLKYLWYERSSDIDWGMPNKRFDTRSALLLLEDEDDVLQEIEEDGLYYPSFGEEEHFVSLFGRPWDDVLDIDGRKKFEEYHAKIDTKESPTPNFMERDSNTIFTDNEIIYPHMNLAISGNRLSKRVPGNYIEQYDLNSDEDDDAQSPYDIYNNYDHKHMFPKSLINSQFFQIAQNLSLPDRPIFESDPKLPLYQLYPDLFNVKDYVRGPYIDEIARKKFPEYFNGELPLRPKVTFNLELDEENKSIELNTENEDILSMRNNNLRQINSEYDKLEPLISEDWDQINLEDLNQNSFFERFSSKNIEASFSQLGDESKDEDMLKDDLQNETVETPALDEEGFFNQFNLPVRYKSLNQYESLKNNVEMQKSTLGSVKLPEYDHPDVYVFPNDRDMERNSDIIRQKLIDRTKPYVMSSDLKTYIYRYSGFSEAYDVDTIKSIPEFLRNDYQDYPTEEEVLVYLQSKMLLDASKYFMLPDHLTEVREIKAMERYINHVIETHGQEHKRQPYPALEPIPMSWTPDINRGVNYTMNIIEMKNKRVLEAWQPDIDVLFENDTFEYNTKNEFRFPIGTTRTYYDWTPTPDNGEFRVDPNLKALMKPLFDFSNGLIELKSTKDDIFLFDYKGPIRIIVGLRAYLLQMAQELYPSLKDLRLETELLCDDRMIDP